MRELRLVLGRRGFPISEGNLEERMNVLQKALEPNVPVMIQDFDRTHFRGGSTQNYLFFSDGKLVNHGLMPRNGGRNRIYAESRESDRRENTFEYYGLVITDEPLKIVVPHSWTTSTLTGCFSSEPGSYDSFHSAGTSFIKVTKNLARQYKNVLDAISFAEQAFVLNFTPNSFYSNPWNRVLKKGVSFDEREKQARGIYKALKLGAARKLVDMAACETLDHYDGGLFAEQIGQFVGLAADFRKRFKQPVNEDDYILRESAHPRRDFGFLKQNGGNVFARPLPGFEKTFELAFSADMQKKLPA